VIDLAKKVFVAGGVTVNEGDVITINTENHEYAGRGKK